MASSPSAISKKEKNKAWLLAGRYILDPNEPLFLPHRFEEAISELKKLETSFSTTSGESTEYTLHDIYNKEHRLPFRNFHRGQKERNQVWHRGVFLQPYFYIPQRYLDAAVQENRQAIEDLEAIGRDWRCTMPFYIGTSESSIHGNPDLELQEDGTMNVEATEKTKQWEREWKASSYRKRLRDFLQENSNEGLGREGDGGTATRLDIVDNILCFGLGDLSWKTSFIQHLVATTIWDFLATNCSRGKQTQIPIFAQDPAYNRGCQALLQQRFNITPVPDPQGFLLIKPTSFVLTFNPDVAVSQAAVDMTWDSTEREGGPAAMLCNTIGELEDDWERVRSLPEDCGGLTDPLSPRLVQFRKECERGLKVEKGLKDGSVDDAVGGTECYIKTRSREI